ncbi:hypothetical protein PpBr36_07033 [Pyricularia pennisetigena]|uniref:hypothetical protein n=1 Tax=Pyricularia pennisetigena TaxID=1578925 RepID=UPI001153143A|nr:hypothetical protein PpBr36_07033 [Pyricularia pennisetigena]TLS25131.1 hypothetical protein PpBr36_07033 [Pyricularia pennisetigena]
MPHKHKRRERDESDFNLPPTVIAKPLPVVAPKKAATAAKQAVSKTSTAHPVKSTKRKRGRDANGDDAPRAFKRLMAFAGGQKLRSGLDDGNPAPSKKKKKKKNNAAEVAAAAETQTQNEPVEIPKIKPGERMSDFAARVDAALPVSGLANKGIKNGKDPLGLKVWRTRKERKMHKLYDQWREEERKIQEKREEAAELAEEKAFEEEEAGIKWDGDDDGEAAGASGKKKKKKGKRARLLGEAAVKEDDPWEELKKKRGEAKIGLNDVAKAPPELKKLTGKKLTVRGAAVEVDGIPKAAGSLRRREELQEVRNNVVTSYRKMMEQKRANLSV